MMVPVPMTGVVVVAVQTYPLVITSLQHIIDVVVNVVGVVLQGTRVQQPVFTAWCFSLTSHAERDTLHTYTRNAVELLNSCTYKLVTNTQQQSRYISCMTRVSALCVWSGRGDIHHGRGDVHHLVILLGHLNIVLNQDIVVVQRARRACNGLKVVVGGPEQDQVLIVAATL
jgi:hypothetical protein